MVKPDSTHGRTGPGFSGKRRVVVLGSTGSVGEKALAVADRFGDRLDVAALYAHRRVDRLAEQVARFQPRLVAVGDGEAARRFDRSCLPDGARFLTGPEGLEVLASLDEAELVVNAVVGSAGLAPSLAALRRGTSLALANKESVVLAGELLMKTARESGATVLPIDSEHSGLLQCLEGRAPGEVARVVLTASGGPFRNHSRQELERVTPDAALNHPVWPMGPRISVDSATLMNKGFEVLEARWLFDIPADRIDVLIHPQSIVHALVEMTDGSVVAQLAAPDMILPVQYAMSWPERWQAPLAPLDLSKTGALEFEPPDSDRFPCLRLAYHAIEAGGVMPAVMNAADEVAVQAFIDGRIRFAEIYSVLREVMDAIPAGPADAMERIMAADRAARELAAETIAALRPV